MTYELKYAQHSAQESFKRYTSLEMKGVMQPKIWLRLPGTCDNRYFRNNYFWLPPDVYF